MSRYIFSKPVTAELVHERSPIQQIVYLLLYKRSDEQINPQLEPTAEDIESIMSSVSEIKGYCLDSVSFNDGIRYLQYSIALSAEALRNSTPNKLATHILINWRSHWHRTRGIDCAPFCPLLTSKKLILAVPVSRKGYMQLALIQREQHYIEKQRLKVISDKEIKRAKALDKFKNTQV